MHLKDLPFVNGIYDVNGVTSTLVILTFALCSGKLYFWRILRDCIALLKDYMVK